MIVELEVETDSGSRSTLIHEPGSLLDDLIDSDLYCLGRDNGITARIRPVESDLKSLQRTMWAATGAVILFNSVALPILIALAVRWIG